MQRQCVRIPIRDGCEAQVLAFVRGLDARRPEVLEALAAEGIVAEAVLVDRHDGRAVLLVYTAGPDLAAANARFQASRLAVDAEFKALMADSLDLASATTLEVLLGVP